ncbi:MAG: hypothetical protein ACM3VV_08380, partial [Deltaproteobacteria bacterium]
IEPTEPTTEAIEPTEPTTEAIEPTEPTTEAIEPTEPTTEKEEILELTTEPSKVENGTSLQQAEQKSSQVASGGTDIDEGLEEYLDKTRDERVDRHLCGDTQYRGVWNYDTKQCEIDDPDKRKEYEKNGQKFQGMIRPYVLIMVENGMLTKKNVRLKMM